MALTYKILVFILHLTVIYTAKLNVPRVLLPYNLGIPTNYTLEVSEGGCYRWSSSRPEVATVTPIDVFPDQQCSNKAVVAAISPITVRQSSIILAQDAEADQLLRCDVIVDSIHSIEIVTTTRELFLEDAPEAFEVLAKNDQEDTFSSLHGVPFEWTLVAEADKTAGDQEPVLRFLDFADSPYETPLHIDYWEQQGLHGFMVLVEGVKTGSAKVRVRLRDPAYMDVKSSEVGLIVVANIVLNPAHDVFLLPQSVVHYRVEHIKQGRAHEIGMPTEDWYLEVDDSNVAQLDHKSTNVTALAYGHAMIILKDKTMKGRDMPRQPSAGIHVVQPSYLLFQVTPGENWALQEFTTYEISVKIYDDHHHRVYLSENLQIQVHFPSKYFQVKFSSSNGTYHVAKTLIPGKSKITAELQGVLKEDGKLQRVDPPIKAFQEIAIYQILQVEPSVILMPWDPVTKPSFSLTMKARGGTGWYHWASTNTSLVKVTYKQELASKTASLTTNGIGEATVFLTDVHNSVFKTTAHLSIQPVADLELIPTVVEAEVGGDVIIPLALYGFEDLEKQKKKVFDDCSEIPVTIEIVDKAKVFYKEDSKYPPMGRGCRSLQFSCKAPGHSRIYVQYNIGDNQLKTTAVVACFKPLKSVYPLRLLLLPLGSSADIAFEGGPRPWPLHQEGHLSKLTVEDDKLATVNHIKDPYRYNKDLHVFNVLCKDFGEMPLQLTVGNEKSATNQNPASSQATVQLVCGVPDALFLKPIIKGPTGKKLPCPIGEEPIRVSTQNYRDLEIDVWAKDKKGRKFANITSFFVKWDLSDYTLAKPESHRDFEVEVNGANGYKKVSRSYQTIHPVGKTGQLKVTATITGYRNDILTKAEVSAKGSELSVSRTVVLDLVDDTSVDPSKVTVFNHATNKAILNVTGGSGYVYVDVSDTSKAIVDYQENTRQILVSPVEDGSFVITVYDMCLEVNNIAVVNVEVSGVEAIRVKMVDKVQLNKSITAVVHVLATGRQPISASLFTIMNLHVVPASGIISTKLQATPLSSDLEATYTVTGLAIGQTTLTFKILPQEKGSSQHSKKLVVSSLPLPVQVFSPLRLSPRNITMVVGDVFEVIYLGGPQPQVIIDYGVQDETISSVIQGGILTAFKLGKTTLTARAVETDKDTGTQIVHSQDQADIFVVPLAGVRIHSPLFRLKVGVHMPLYAMGMNEHETPFAFGSTTKHLVFKWTVNNVEVVKLESVYKEQVAGDSFAVRLITLRPGHATVTLEVRSGGDSQLMLLPMYKDEIQLQVFDDLRLLKPEVSGSTILMTPNTVFPLKSNRDSLSRIAYKIIPIDDANVATIDNKRVLRSGSQAGEMILVVTSTEDFGVSQTRSLVVKVRHLSYITINAETVIRTGDKPLAFIPIAYTVLFKVTFHTNIGEVFQATNSQLLFRLSRFDIVQIGEGSENGTLIVRASKQGQTILKVWDKVNPHIADYINIVVRPSIYPSDLQLTVGDVACFHSSLLSDQGLPGTWMTDSRALQIDRNSGTALALEAGNAVIYYNVSATVRTSTQVTISPVGIITVDDSNIRNISNVIGTSLKVPVYLGQEGRIRKGNRIGRNCTGSHVLPTSAALYTCEVSFHHLQREVVASDVFETESLFDWKLGMYYCHIRPVHKLPVHQISLLVTNVWLRVQLVKSGQSSLSEVVEIPFMPAFYVQLEELVLSNVHPVGTIPIVASAKVADRLVVLPNDNNILEVLPAESDAKMPSTLLYPVRVRELSSLWQVDTLTSMLNIHISCSVTHQTVEIRVKLKLIGTQDGSVGYPPIPHRTNWHDLLYTSWTNYQAVMMALLTIVGTIAVIYIGCRAVTGPRYAQPGVLASRSSPVYPYTPYRQSTSSDNTNELSRPLWTEDHTFTSSPHRISTPLRISPSSSQHRRTSFI